MINYEYHLGMDKKERTYPLQENFPSEADAQEEMDKFFTALEERLKKESPEVLKAGARQIQEFIEGKIGWADLFNMTPQTLLQLAEMGYTRFKVGRYDEAEKFFKVLTFLDWDNSYYHSMMGSILQKQKRFGEAIVEYTQALETNPKDVVSLTNRGEIFFLHGWIAQAEGDFDKAIALDPKQENKWANRARILKIQILKNRQPEAPAPAKTPETKKGKSSKAKGRE